MKLVDGNHYIGYSSDLKQRVEYHVQGRVSQTKNWRPLKLIYYSAFASKTKALDFEKYLKSSSGFAFRNKHLI